VTNDLLPVLDVSHFDGPEAGEFVAALRAAAHGPGFCYIVGHGIDSALESSLLNEARTFFHLPEATRRAIAIGNSPHFRGYTILGDERTAGANDWRDQIDIGADEDAVPMTADDPPWQRLRGPNQWPAEVPGLRRAVLPWLEQMRALATKVMRALAVGLGQSVDYFDDAISGTPYPRVKVIRYPAQPEHGGSPQGLGLHHDSGLLSFILQDDVGGLQVQSGDRLVDVVPQKGAYIMNLGEMLQVASNGYLRATPHRVQSPPPGKERVSIAYFFNPRLDAVFDAIPLPPALAAAAPGGQNSDQADPVFRSFGANTLKIRMRAHPDVTQKFYADVDLHKL
jgi:isopenicillin N synthase-like dioxygenase